MNSFLTLQQQRRSIYAIGKNVTLSPEAINTLIINAIRESPSAFNSQSSRAVILFDTAHDSLWDMVLNALRPTLPEEAFVQTEKKINTSFKSGMGTVLFFEDQHVVKGLQEKFPLYAEHFPIWSEQASGMAQYAVWLALMEEKIGATLQHYTPLIEDKVRATWDIPLSWQLQGQMPFGSIEAPAAHKTYMPNEERFKQFS